MRTGSENNRLRWIAGLACVMGIFSLVCSPPDGPTNQHGELGNLQLMYWDEDTTTHYRAAPILAVDAMADATVLTLPDDDGNDRGAVGEIVDISFSDSGVLSAQIEQPDFITLAAESVDTPLMKVEVITDSGERLRDEFMMETRRVNKLDLSDACQRIPNQSGLADLYGSTYNTTYLTGSTPAIDYYLRDENRTHLFGYGYFPFDITGDAELILDEDSTDPRRFHFQTGQQPGSAEIASTVDMTKVAVDLIDSGDIDGATVSQQQHLAHLAVEHVWDGYIVPQANGNVVCYADIDRSVTSLTPEICKVELTPDGAGENDANDIDDESIDVATSPQPYAATTITRQRVGACEIEVTFAAGNDGQGATTVITIDDGDLDFTNQAINQ